MSLTMEIQEYIDRSVLCWLATANREGIPNVSPKEVFCSYDSNKIIVANIASPQTVANIRENPNVCISFIDILVQKGFQLKGLARILDASDPEFSEMHQRLSVITAGKFPFKSITVIDVNFSKPILAPSYILYPETTEDEQIENARRAYGL